MSPAFADAHVVKYSGDCGYRNTFFEGDAPEIINLVQSPSISLRSYGHITDDINLSARFKST